MGLRSLSSRFSYVGYMMIGARGEKSPLVFSTETMKTIGYFKLNGMVQKKDETGLSQAVVKQRLRKASAKIECLVKAIEKHKDSAADGDIRVCDQKLWSAGEMINYGN